MVVVRASSAPCSSFGSPGGSVGSDVGVLGLAGRDDDQQHRQSDGRAQHPRSHRRIVLSGQWTWIASFRSEATGRHGGRSSAFAGRIEVDRAATYPGARAPDRTWRIDADGLGLAAYGGVTRAHHLSSASTAGSISPTFDVFAPKLADAGWRVVSWDQRGHGDSDRAALYSWDADLRDSLAVFDQISREPPGPRHRAFEGRRHDDPARRRPAVPVLAHRQSRRHSVPEPHSRRRRASAHEDDRQRDRGLAGAPAWHGERRAQAGHDRGSPNGSGDEPSPVEGLAAPSRHRRRS